MTSDDIREIYLDNNATTRPLPEVQEAMLNALGDGFGNPSSAHLAGDRAREKIRLARDSLAKLLYVDPHTLYFTSSGTESNNMVLASAVRGREKFSRIVTTQVEHSSVLKMCEYLEELGVDIVYLSVDKLGHINLEELKGTITPNTVLVSIQWVNNETGVMQPIDKIGKLCNASGVAFHTDAAQAVGKIRMNVAELPIDFLSLTGHKFHGPQGIGAVYVRNSRSLQAIFYGGPQEDGMRPGTENVPGIVGIGKAAELRYKHFKDVETKLRDLRDQFEKLVMNGIPDAKVNGDTKNRVCNTTNLFLPGVDGQALVARLDQAGIRCSQNSACTNQRPEPSYVLEAMGLSEEDAYASIRFGFSEENNIEEVELAARKVVELCNVIRLAQTRLRTHSSQKTAEVV